MRLNWTPHWIFKVPLCKDSEATPWHPPPPLTHFKTIPSSMGNMKSQFLVSGKNSQLVKFCLLNRLTAISSSLRRHGLSPCCTTSLNGKTNIPFKEMTFYIRNENLWDVGGVGEWVFEKNAFRKWSLGSGALEGRLSSWEHLVLLQKTQVQFPSFSQPLPVIFYFRPMTFNALFGP